ncbi:MAG: transcription elongation factor subunit Spt4 [Nanoarchaeota archaeon]
MAGMKACKKCKAIVGSGNKCLQCGSNELAETFKGKLVILDEEKSEIAKNVKISKKGEFAIKTG